MPSTVGVNLSLGYVPRVAFRAGTSWPAIGTATAAPAAVASRVIGARTGMARRVVLLATFLDNPISDLLVRISTIPDLEDD